MRTILYGLLGDCFKEWVCECRGRGVGGLVGNIDVNFTIVANQL